MLTPEERALLMQAQEKVIELAVCKEAARDHGDRAREKEIAGEIETLLGECRVLKQGG